MGIENNEFDTSDGLGLQAWLALSAGDSSSPAQEVKPEVVDWSDQIGGRKCLPSSTIRHLIDRDYTG
jgi:hypothetical protein